MPNITANGIQIEYETSGDPSSPVLLLIMGLSAQLIDWDEEFLAQLLEKGVFIIRFDNRDAGLSTKFEEGGIPDMKGTKKGKGPRIPYTLDDMADDAVGLLDALGIEKAHICGISMGGMIAQHIALSYPDRVRKLVLACTFARRDADGGRSSEWMKRVGLRDDATNDELRAIDMRRIGQAYSLAINGRLAGMVAGPLMRLLGGLLATFSLNRCGRPSEVGRFRQQ